MQNKRKCLTKLIVLTGMVCLSGVEITPSLCQKTDNKKLNFHYQDKWTRKENESKNRKEESNWISLGTFKITYYWEGEDEWGAMTATGVIAQGGRTIAVDPSVIPYGSEIMIDGHIYIAEDCGGAVKGNVIDIFVNKPRQEMYYREIYIHVNEK